MSYKIYLFKLAPGDDPLTAARQRLADEPPLSAALPPPDVLAAALLAHDPSLRVEPARPTQPLRLTTAPGGVGIEIQLFDDLATVSLAEWHTGAAAQAIDALWHDLDLLVSAAGGTLYDPQRDQIVDLQRDRAAVRASYAASVQRLRTLRTPPDPPRL